MKLHNTLSGQKEEFVPLNGSVKMYVCGITPYSASHVGHAMVSVIFDVLRRYLEYKGHSVSHIQNFTDIDDKMIRAANERGITVKELGEENIQTYLNEMDTLNILRADRYPKATEEIDKIVEIIQSLIESGYAYESQGDVYFRVHKDEDYGKLSHRDLDSLMAGARVEVGEIKENAADFALWKAEKPNEPAWDAPWGSGRPGWHIECSAMSLEYLGETLDIHGGGQDLIFPHHENEIAQSESFTNSTPFSRFWLHNGMLRLGEDKMSKSIGNIVSVREALDSFSPDALRLFFLSSHYRSPLIYSDDNISSQERAAERLRNAATGNSNESVEAALDAEIFRTRFIEAMDDDLNSPRALAAMFDLSREINREREQGTNVCNAQAILKELSGIFGLTLDAPTSDESTDAAPFIELLIDVRKKLREVRQFEIADEIRDKLGELDVALEDTPQGTDWKLRSQ